MGLMVFFIRHQSKMPYYRISQADCIMMLDKAINGTLPELEWHAFIGMSIRDNDNLEALREQCCWLDEVADARNKVCKRA